MLEEAFWASLKTEEGQRNGFALEYGPAGENGALHKDPIVFAEPLPFTSAILAKLAPALHPTQIIGVWARESAKGVSKLAIWGFAKRLAGSSLSLETLEPGKIILAFHEYQKAVIDGQRADFVSEHAIDLLRGILCKVRRNDLSKEEDKHVERFHSSDLARIALAMRSHAKGGTLLVVRNQADLPVEIRYPVKPDETLKTYLAERDSLLREGRLGGDAEAFRKSCESIGQLTAVDGATLVTSDLCLLGFGAKTKPKPGSSTEHFNLRLSGPFENSKLRKERFLDMVWGTRHKSAAQFISDQKDALAIVASQDGKLSVFTWDDRNKAVSVTEEVEFLLL